MSSRFNLEKHAGYGKLKEAFRLSNKDFLDSIELAPENEVYFSERYKKRINKIINGQRLPYWKFINTTGKKICAFVLAFLLLFSASLSIKAIREPVFEFITNVFEKFSELFVDKSDTINAPNMIEEIYTLTNIPLDFIKEKEIIDDFFVETSWTNGNISIVLKQYTLFQKITNDIEDVDAITFVQDNMKVHFLCKYNTTYVVWNNGRYIFSITWQDKISVETMKEIIKSIKIKE